jgi:hypothetical protein
MRRTLLLDENDLIMVVKEDVVKQIDENRGEMNRTEFVNYLIQCQLREGFNRRDYVTREEFQHFTRQIMELLHSFLQFFVSYGMALGRKQQHEDFETLNRQLESFDKSDEETSDNKYDEEVDES